MKKILFAFIAISLFVVLAGNYGTRSKAQILAVDFHKQEIFAKLIDSAKKTGSVHVIVGLNTEFIPEGNLKKAEMTRQRLGIKDAQDAFLNRYAAFRGGNVKRFEYIPFLALETDAASLRLMQEDSLVASIQEDEIADAALAQSIPIVGANTAWNLGYTGSGQTVVIIDSGVDKNHSFLGGRVISEACYSSNTASSTSFCPGGVTESTASDSGLNCLATIDGCPHGTNVAGIAAGNDGVSIGGVAKNANIIAIQIFSQFTPTACGSASPCARYWTSDLIKGLERVRTLANTMNNIAAVNLSLQTGQQFPSNCDAAHAATKAAIDNLRSVNIATVICSGNFAFTNALTAPACISTSISVGSVDDGSLGTMTDVVSSFSDSSPLLHLLAPGRWINSSIPGNLFQNYSGTSMATPHVTGAFAVLRQRKPTASIQQIQDTLIATGQPITDSRNGIVKPRLKVASALQAIGGTTAFDFDGDRKTDISIFRPSAGEWWYQRSSDGQVPAFQFGNSSDKITPADYTGDGKTDVAFWRPSTGEWFILRSEDSSYYSFPFGTSGDIPAPADFDSDGKADATVFRPSSATWFILRSSGGTTFQPFGQNGDAPVVADYDNDGKADIAIYRPSLGQWWIQRSTAGTIAYTFGNSSDKPVQGDYTGDGKADVALWRDSTGEWFVLRSEDASYYSFPFGTSGDIAAPGDYDGDGKFDATVFRPSAATWFSQRSTAGTLIQGFGLSSDLPVPNAFVP